MNSTLTAPKYIDELDQLEDFPIREGLGWKARKEASFIRSIARGVMLITGSQGSGKDLFGISLCAMNKYYLADIIDPSRPRKILLDFYPKRAFGEYIFFDPEIMLQEINKMAKAAKMEGFETSEDPEESDFIKESTRKWALEGEGELLLKGAVMYLSELKRYCYNRNPHSPINKYIGSINTLWRHLDLLVLGTHVKSNEIDVKSFLEYVTHNVNCDWSMTREHTTVVTLSSVRYMSGNDVYKVVGKKRKFLVNGNEPKTFLDGKKFYDLYETKNIVNIKPALRKEK